MDLTQLKADLKSEKADYSKECRQIWKKMVEAIDDSSTYNPIFFTWSKCGNCTESDNGVSHQCKFACYFRGLESGVEYVKNQPLISQKIYRCNNCLKKINNIYKLIMNANFGNKEKEIALAVIELFVKNFNSCHSIANNSVDPFQIKDCNCKVLERFEIADIRIMSNILTVKKAFDYIQKQSKYLLPKIKITIEDCDDWSWILILSKHNSHNKTYLIKTCKARIAKVDKIIDKLINYFGFSDKFILVWNYKKCKKKLEKNIVQLYRYHSLFKKPVKS